MFDVFDLTLMVNHMCNLRCSYCYTGAKEHRPMELTTGLHAIDCGVNSVKPGGEFHLGFFGGEPLLESDAILRFVSHAQKQSADCGQQSSFSMTTNATVTHTMGWEVMSIPNLSLSISHDGLPEVHDRYRFGPDGSPSSDVVLATICRLVNEQRRFNVISVVRPDTVEFLADGIEFLHTQGVTQFSPSLDLWTDWDHDAGIRLEDAVSRLADLWIDNFPHLNIGWFNDKAAALLELESNKIGRCGFGVGQVAVSPAGNLYPCERLIGEDHEHHPMRLPADLGSLSDFLNFSEQPEGRSADACSTCVIQSICSTSCRCSNYVRTGNVSRPDGLLCLLDRLCYRETYRVLSQNLQQSHPENVEVSRVET